MIRHYLIATLHNMAANRLLSVIAILGLAVGITAALLMALVIRNQLSFDHFIPGYDRTYLAATEGADASQPPWIMDRTHRLFAALLKLNIPQIESATRLMITDQVSGGDVTFRRGDFVSSEKIYWADPNAFDVLPLPALYGDLNSALHSPDGLVLPRSAAEKYFGRDNAVGQELLLNGHPMVVRAVIADLPANATELETGIFASNLAPYLGFGNYKPSKPGEFTPADIGVRTYIRLYPGASLAEVEAKAATLIKPIYTDFSMPLFRLDRVHLVETLNADLTGGLNTGVHERIALSAAVGFLILIIAAINFANLSLARSMRREREVGIRKAAGANRSQLMVQFIGESILLAAVATIFAMALCEWLLPVANAFLNTGAQFDYWNDPWLTLTLLLSIPAIGLCAGAYPAFVLSSFRPSSVLRGLIGRGSAAGTVRHMLVILQFATLIMLVIAAGVFRLQRAYATRDALRVNIDQMLIVEIPGNHAGCPATLKTEVRRLPGVLGASCTGNSFLDVPMTWSYHDKGKKVLLGEAPIDWGILALYGVKPLAGSLASLPSDYRPDESPGIVINQAAVRLLGFDSAAAAIGHYLPYTPGTPDKIPVPIVAVVKDFSLYSVTHRISPTVYDGLRNGDALGSLLHIKLAGREIPETLAAIDRAWRVTGQTGPMHRYFLSDHMQQRYLALLREAQMAAVCSGVALFLACLGLAGIAIATTEQRTKEIGVRKAMGARESQIVWLLLWQFARPALSANLIAWPLAWWAMNHWLNGFAYHVAMPYWLFPAVGVATVLIAMLTVANQAWLAARQKPVLALRYE